MQRHSDPVRLAFWNAYAKRFRPQIVVVYPSPAFYIGNELAGWPAPTSGTPPAEQAPSSPTRPGDAFLLLGMRRYAPRATADDMRFAQRVARRTREYAAKAGVAPIDIDSAMTGRYQVFGDGVHFTDEGGARVAGTASRPFVSRCPPQAAARPQGSTKNLQ